ncbi:MAG: molybdopterin-binding protein, partial [Pseudomonadota bacterium]
MKHVDPSAFPGAEIVPTSQALGRVTASPAIAAISSPHFHSAAMDGFAIRAQDSFGAGPDRPIRFKLGTTAWPVNTGRPIPPGTDAVVMIEDADFVGEDSFEIDKGLVPWQYVRRVGEDFVVSEMILPARHLINPYDQGALLAGGVFDVKVVEKPRVVLVPTGNELVSAESLKDRQPHVGEAIEFNSVMLTGLVERTGGSAHSTDIVPDDFDALRTAVKSAAESDAHMVVILAGSSAGSEDFTAAVIRGLGELLVHGVAMMPGKPTILGIVNGKPILGNPGYPVSAVLSFELFGLPVLDAMLGRPRRNRPSITA